MTDAIPNVVWILEEVNGDAELTIKVFMTEQKAQIYQQQRIQDLAAESFKWYKEKKLVKKQQLRLDEEAESPNCVVHIGAGGTTTTKEVGLKFQTWWQKLEPETQMDPIFVELYHEMEMDDIDFTLNPHPVLWDDK